jgi:predicted nucleic acid-binding Zn ribbon protein
MPTYVYECPECKIREERMFVDIEFRDTQECGRCNEVVLKRIPVFTGSVWAPTAGGMR